MLLNRISGESHGRCISHGGACHTMEEDFGIATPTANKIFHNFLNVVRKELGHLIQWPSSARRLEKVMSKFAERGMIGAVGAIDCVHVKTGKCHDFSNSGEIFVHRKGGYTPTSQVVADLDCFIMDAVVGWPPLLMIRACCALAIFLRKLKQSKSCTSRSSPSLPPPQAPGAQSVRT